MSGRFLGLENSSGLGPCSLPWLRVFPPELIFTNIHANVTYTAQLTLRNADSRLHFVKVLPPGSSRFSLPGANAQNGLATTTRLSPGLTTTFEVSFCADEQNDFFDKCVIQTDAGETFVPLVARAPRPTTKIEGSLDFGILAPGDSATRAVTVSNVGAVTAVVQARWDTRRGLAEDVFRVTPSGLCTLKPGENLLFTAELSPKEIGDFDAAVDFLTASGFSDDEKKGSSNAFADKNTKSERRYATGTVVPNAPEFLTDDKHIGGDACGLRVVDFGHVLCGDTRLVRSAVYNNSPSATKFKVKLRSGETHNTRDVRFFTVTPDQGVLAPYEKRAVVFQIAPPLPEKGIAKGFKTLNSGNAGGLHTSQNTQNDETDARDVSITANVVFETPKLKPFNIPVTARLVTACVSLDPRILDFGAVDSNDRGDHLVTVRNLTNETNCDFAFGRSAYFKPSPTFGTVLPGQTVTVSVAYQPKGLGSHTANLTCQVLGRGYAVDNGYSGSVDNSGNPSTAPRRVVVFETSVKCVGRCREVGGWSGGLKPTRGLTAHPDDFEKQKKYVNPAEVNSQYDTLRLRKATARLDKRSSTEKALSIYNERADPDPSAHALTLDQASRKLQHKSAYDEYIADSRKHRVAQMSKKQDDPNDATTLGLRNQYDLKPRKDIGGVFGSMKHDLGPALPAADEPLWMDKSVLTSCEHAADDGNRRSKSKRKSAAKIPFSYLRPRNRPQQAVEAETSAGSGGPKTDAPCAPVTAAQLKDCTRVLLPNEISQLSAGPSSLNFGSVAVGSRHTQYFAFTNGTAKAVLVRMETKREGSVAYSEATTRYSTGSSMVTESEQLSDECGVLSLSSMGERACVKVIEPGATNHFGVFFEATAGTHDLKTLTFKDQIGYTINDNPNHVFSFDVIAEVLPAALDLSAEEMLFSFPPNDDESFSVTRTVKVSNRNHDPTTFVWELPTRSAFSVHPKEALVGGKESVFVNVTWTPNEVPESNDTQLPMCVLGDATPRVLHCVGELGSPSVVFADTTLKFGPSRAGFRAKQTVTLKNTSAHDAVFRVDDKHDETLEDASHAFRARVTCHPKRGRVRAGSTFELCVVFVNPAPGVHHSNLKLHVRGGKAVTLPVSIHAVAPNVFVVEKFLHLGDVFVGSKKQITATLRNDSAVAAQLVCDCRHDPCLALTCDSFSYNNEVYDEPPVLQVPKHDNVAFGTLGNSVVKDLLKLGSAVAAARRGMGDDNGGDRFRITIAPNSDLAVTVEYRPLQGFPERTFLLPLFLEGGDATENASATADFKDLQRAEPNAAALAVPVSVKASEPRVKLSATSLEFGQKILTREGFRKVPHVVELRIKHNDDGDDADAIKWRLGSLADSSFSFDPKHGVLSPNQCVTIKCTFSPHDATTYKTRVPLYLDDDADESGMSKQSEPSRTSPSFSGPRLRVSTGSALRSSFGGSATTSPRRKSYLTVDVSGEGVFPRLDFDTREVVLPPTPPGVPATRRFHLISKGYGNEKITHRTPRDTSKIQLLVTYPEGDQIGVAKPTLPIDVTFASATCMSFTASIDFLDEEGNRFCVPVSGAVDNSQLTLETFWDANNANFQIDEQLRNSHEKPAVLSTVGSGTRSVGPFAGVPLTTPSERELEFRGQNQNALAQWLQVTTPFGPFLGNDTSAMNLAQTLRRRGGKTFVDLVEFWSGKKVIGKTLNISRDQRLALMQTLRQYEALLTHLKSCGATLAGIRPEMLIETEDFTRLARSYARQIEHREVTIVEADRMRGWIALDNDPPAREKRERLAQAAWRATLMQTIKIFVLNRVTPAKSSRKESSLPKESSETQKTTTKPRQSNNGLGGSNVFSVSEQVLLTWLTRHARRVFGDDYPRVENFGSDLRDGVVFYAVVVSHWPAVQDLFAHKMTFPKKETGQSTPGLTEQQCVSNACVVLEALAFARQPYADADVSSGSFVITNASSAERVLFTLFLHQVLPQLTPKTTIAFPCRLGRTTSKDVSLQNPSGVGVTYCASLEGPESAISQFSLEQSVIKIGGKGEAAVRVRCSPTIARAETTDSEDLGRTTTTKKKTGGDSNHERETLGEGLQAEEPPRIPTARCFLVLTSSKEGASSGSSARTIVFQLEAFVDADAPVAVETFGCKTYEISKTKITVKNPFPRDCEFVVTCQNLRLDDPKARDGLDLLEQGNAKENTSSRRKVSRKDGSIGVTRGADIADITRRADGSVVKSLSCDKVLSQLPRVMRSKYPGAFGAERIAAKVRGNETMQIDVAFLPFAPGAHVARLTFEDPDHGRFVVELCGYADLPDPVASIKSDLEVRPQTFDVVVDHANPGFERARKTFLEQHPGRTDRAEAMKARAASDAWPNSISYKALSHSSYVDTEETVVVSRNPEWQPGQEFDPISMKTFANKIKPMRLGLNVRDAGLYKGVVVLGSEHDVRVLHLEFTAGVKRERACLEFTCSARQVVTQDIPVVNGGAVPMSVKGTITGPDAHCFAGAGRDVLVAKGRRDVFPLSFHPPKQGTFHATLTLRTGNDIIRTGNRFGADNTTADTTGDAQNEQTSYKLTGHASPPEAEAAITIHAVARGACVETLRVPNVFQTQNKTAQYEVECDLDFVGGEASLLVERGGYGEYVLNLAPVRSGTFHGSVHFTTKCGAAVWYAVTVLVDRPAASAVVEDFDSHTPDTSPLVLRAVTHTAVRRVITLKNPVSTKSVVFRVRHSGHGLLGAPTLTLAPGKSGEYEVVYSPLLPGAECGSVSFTHPTLGEFWYPIELVSTEAPHVEVPRVSSSLGSQNCETKLRFQNPTDQVIEVELGSSNELNFSIVSPASKTLTIKPFEKGKIVVRFLPSKLNTVQNAVITAVSATGGAWRWKMTGTADPPSSNGPPTKLFVTLGQSGSHAVTFHNPFEFALSIRSWLESAGSGAGVDGVDGDESSGNGHFELLQSARFAKGVVVGANTAVSIPFAFKPTSMLRTETVLVVRSASRGADVPPLTWRFPITGEPECPPSGHQHSLIGKARRRFEMGVAVSLKHLPDQGGGGGVGEPGVPFTFEISAPQSEREHLQKALVVTPLCAVVKNGEVKFHVSLRPVRELHCVVDLLVSVKTGGRWRFPVQIAADAPEVDGFIEVKAHVGHPQVSLFHLPNPDVVAANFTAFFTPDSPGAFSVTPGTGVMEAGTPISVPGAHGVTTGNGVTTGDGVNTATARKRFDVASEAAENGPGVTLRIGYAPVEYGTSLVGRLRIVTKENTWTFEVIGTTPTYVKPTAPARVDTHISKETDAKMKEARARNAGNVVARNTKQAHYTSRKMFSAKHTP